MAKACKIVNNILKIGDGRGYKAQAKMLTVFGNHWSL